MVKWRRIKREEYRLCLKQISILQQKLSEKLFQETYSDAKYKIK